MKCLLKASRSIGADQENQPNCWQALLFASVAGKAAGKEWLLGELFRSFLLLPSERLFFLL
jgi:hypothetical protein